jgi:hypothetical protein
VIGMSGAFFLDFDLVDTILLKQTGLAHWGAQHRHLHI